MKYAVLFTCLAIAGCATPLQQNQTQLTIQSIPAGAMLYEGPNALGIAPQQRIYTSNNGVAKTTPLTAVWASGARYTTSFNIRLGARQTATFSRPPTAPGLAQDLAYAEQLRQNDMAQQAANDIAWANVIRAALPPQTVTTNCMKIGVMVSCTSQ